MQQHAREHGQDEDGNGQAVEAEGGQGRTGAEADQAPAETEEGGTDGQRAVDGTRSFRSTSMLASKHSIHRRGMMLRLSDSPR